MLVLAPPPTDQDDVALLRAAVSGESGARAQLVRRLIPVVRARVRRAEARAGRKLNGDDLTQEVWLALFSDGGKKLLAFAPDRGATMEGFVGLLAEREVGQRLRARRAQKRGGHLELVSTDDAAGLARPVEDPAPSPEAVAETSDLAGQLGTYLQDHLPERGRLVFRYVFTDGLEPAEAARVMGVKVQVVYNWQHKIRGLARDFLNRAEAS